MILQVLAVPFVSGGIAIPVIDIRHPSQIIKVIGGNQVVRPGGQVSILATVLKDRGSPILVGDGQGLAGDGTACLPNGGNPGYLQVIGIGVVYLVAIGRGDTDQGGAIIRIGGGASIRVSDARQISVSIIGKAGDAADGIMDLGQSG